jgi:hypothetical protein
MSTKSNPLNQALQSRLRLTVLLTTLILTLPVSAVAAHAVADTDSVKPAELITPSVEESVAQSNSGAQALSRVQYEQYQEQAAPSNQHQTAPAPQTQSSPPTASGATRDERNLLGENQVPAEPAAQATRAAGSAEAIRDILTARPGPDAARR